MVAKGSCGSLLVEPNPENKEIVIYVQKLIEDNDKKVGDTHDLSMFRMNSFGSTQKVDDLFDEISKIISKTMPVSFYPLNVLIEGRNLRASSFFIIVSDDSNFVSRHSTMRSRTSS